MKIALFGGSFNPPHVAHLMVAIWVKSTRAVDEVWFVPTYQHAFGKALIDFDARCDLVSSAIATLGSWAHLSRVEADLGIESRTIDTVEHLQTQRPDVDFSLVIGADILLEAPKWKQFDRLQTLLPFHIVGRSGFDVPGRDFGPVLPEISSSELRRRLGAGDLAYCRERIPFAALAEIVARGLYDLPGAARRSWSADGPVDSP